MLRRQHIADVALSGLGAAAVGLDWRDYAACTAPQVDRAAGAALRNAPAPAVSPPEFAAEVMAAHARASDAADFALPARQIRDAEYDRREEAIRARWPVPPPRMAGGCGEGDPGTPGADSLAASPWLPHGERFDVTVSGDAWSRHMALFEQAHDEENARTGNVRLLDPGEGWARDRLAPAPDITELDPGEELPPGVTPLLPMPEPRQDDEALDEHGNGQS